MTFVLVSRAGRGVGAAPMKLHFGIYRITVDTDGFVLILEESVRGEMEAKTALERHAHERRHDTFTVIESTRELPRHISGKWQHVAHGRGIPR